MTVRELKEMVNAVAEEELDCEVIMPIHGDMPGMFVFEGVCPGLTGMGDIGPAPEYMDDSRGEDKHKEMRAFLIAPHSMHDDDEHETEKQKTLN